MNKLYFLMTLALVILIVLFVSMFFDLYKLTNDFYLSLVLTMVLPVLAGTLFTIFELEFASYWKRLKT